MINIENIQRPKGYAPFRQYKKYFCQDYAEKYLITAIKNGDIDEIENEARFYIPTAFGKKQVFIDFIIRKGNKIGFIEIDGPQHFKYVPAFHKNGVSDLIKQKHRDSLVNSFCKSYGKILRLPTEITGDNKINKETYRENVRLRFEKELSKFIRSL